VVMRTLLLACCIVGAAVRGGAEHPSYRHVDLYTAASETASRSKEWKPGEGLVLEASGMTWTKDGRLAVTIRKGEVWFLDGIDGDSSEVTFHRFASGLHEPLGIERDGDDFLVVQRSEVTRLRDTDGDDVADAYLTEAAGWNVSGNYHGYAYGPERDGEGRLWVTLNLDMGDRADNSAAWRGWALRLGEKGELIPVAGGTRSPCGMGRNAEGDMFYSDQQGTWIPATPIHHLREGAFYGNPDGMASQNRPGAPAKLSAEVPNKVLFPEAVRALPELVPPAVWMPYNKMGRSATDIELIDADGRFGPFDGQLLVGEFTNAGVNRVFLEKVGGEYQGACFPFLSGFPSAVVSLLFDEEGDLFVGMTNRGWSSLGSRAYGLTRVEYDAENPPFAIREMRAKPDGFELVFTEPVDPATIEADAAFAMTSYTYLYSSAYGSEEMDTRDVAISAVEVDENGRHVRLRVEGLREMYVHELRTEGIRSSEGKALDHPDAYYTLSRIPGN